MRVLGHASFIRSKSLDEPFWGLVRRRHQRKASLCSCPGYLVSWCLRGALESLLGPGSLCQVHAGGVERPSISSLHSSHFLEGDPSERCGHPSGGLAAMPMNCWSDAHRPGLPIRFGTAQSQPARRHMSRGWRVGPPAGLAGSFAKKRVSAPRWAIRARARASGGGMETSSTAASVL